MSHIKTQIKKYFNEKDNTRIIDMIRGIHNIIEREQNFIDVYKKLKLIPFKFFNISIKEQNLFQINELKDDTKLIIIPSYPIVIDCINEIFTEGKINKLKESSNNSITSNIQKSKTSFELEENFNDFLWMYKKKKFHGCNIKNKINVSSIRKMNENDGKLIKQSIKDLKTVDDSLLIIQDYENGKHFDTAILKLSKIKNDEGFYDLYLFQETLKKQAHERLNDQTLNNDKICLKFIFFINCSIKLDNIYFSYVFDEGNPDNQTIKYCDEIKINYLILLTKLDELKDSNIDPKIKSRFSYPISKGLLPKNEYLLSHLNVDFTLEENELKNQHKKLEEFLTKKTKLKENLKEKTNKELKNKILNIQKLVNNKFRNREIEDKLIEEELMLKENEDIVGISYLVDKETKSYLNKIKFTDIEKKNLLKLMNFYGGDLEILKIVELEPFNFQIPNYDCAIIFVNKNLKIFIDIRNKESYSLLDLSRPPYILDGKFYLIKFIPKTMLLKTTKLKKSCSSKK